MHGGTKVWLVQSVGYLELARQLESFRAAMVHEVAFSLFVAFNSAVHLWGFLKKTESETEHVHAQKPPRLSAFYATFNREVGAQFHSKSFVH